MQGREREGGDESEGCQQGSLRLPRHQGLPGSSGWPQVLLHTSEADTGQDLSLGSGVRTVLWIRQDQDPFINKQKK